MNSYGTPGGTLTAGDQGFGKQSTRVAGHEGELLCARLLKRTFAHDPDVWVFHDLNLPGTAANVDHAVARGNRLLLLDAKRWKAGIYWTLAGTTRRGLTPVPHADGRGLATGMDIVQQRINDTAAHNPAMRNVTVEPFTLVFPTGASTTSVWAYRPPDGSTVKVATGRVGKVLVRHLAGDPTPNPTLIETLLTLVRHPEQRTQTQAGG